LELPAATISVDTSAVKQIETTRAERVRPEIRRVRTWGLHRRDDRHIPLRERCTARRV